MGEIPLRRSFDSVDAPKSSAEIREYSDKHTDYRNHSYLMYDVVKYYIDVVIAVSALLVLLPLILMVVAVMLVLQGRPIFIAHKRIGRNGEAFPCLKFRTMVSNAGEVLAGHLRDNPVAQSEWEASRKLKNDPRVTPFGRILRKSSVDELPQLFNILAGHMSLVGPRPIVESEVEFYGASFKDYVSVKPGLTGLWQISGRSDTSYSSRVALDVEYVSRRSIARDIGIMFRTIPAVLNARGSY